MVNECDGGECVMCEIGKIGLCVLRRVSVSGIVICERLETVLAKWQLGSLLVQAWI